MVRPDVREPPPGDTRLGNHRLERTSGQAPVKRLRGDRLRLLRAHTVRDPHKPVGAHTCRGAGPGWAGPSAETDPAQTQSAGGSVCSDDGTVPSVVRLDLGLVHLPERQAAVLVPDGRTTVRLRRRRGGRAAASDTTRGPGASLAAIEQVSLLRPDAGGWHNGLYYGVLVDRPAELSAFLFSRGIDSETSEYLNCADLDIYRDYRTDCPVAREIQARILRLPNYPSLSRTEVRRIGRAIRDFFALRR